MSYKEDEILLCTVERIEPTAVFVRLPDNSQGSIVMSEIAAGRIRNIREYVVVNKKIACKIMHIKDNHIQLSLRRVTAKERDEVQQKFKKEMTFKGMLKAIINNPEEKIKEIKEKYTLEEFLEKARKDKKIIIEFFSKPEGEKIEKAIAEKKEKEKETKKVITLSSDTSNGIHDIKETLNLPEVKIQYLGSSKFSLMASSTDIKNANSIIQKAIEELHKRAKEKKLHLEIKEK